jgi:uncharacterized protein YbjT (DUF2867 family)
MILVTGAGGKTGRAVMRALAARGEKIRALIHRDNQADAVRSAGAHEIVAGDMHAEIFLRDAMNGAQKIYHLCPNVSPDEVTIGRAMIAAARATGVEQFVYHSVLHPQAEKMPHHWNKLRVEEMLFESGLSFTILQPTAYMQNVLGAWTSIVDRGIYAVPYPATTRLSLVDLDDVAQAAAMVLTESGHDDATYELVGTTAMSQVQVADVLSEKLGRNVRVEEQSIETWERDARTTGMNSFAIETLKQMFGYYTRFGLSGNPNGLTHLLRRVPTTFEAFVEKTIREHSSPIHR